MAKKNQVTEAKIASLKVEKSIEVFNFVFPFLGLNVPSYVTVRDWVLKAGLDTYAHRCKSFDFKGCLERTHSADLKDWSRQNLPENLAAKRVRILRNAA